LIHPFAPLWQFNSRANGLVFSNRESWIMKKMGILVLIYLLGGISGAVYHSMTTGAADRARIAALDGTLKERNEKLEKCTTALIEGLHPTVTALPEKTK
jgi:hypothetical protein